MPEVDGSLHFDTSMDANGFHDGINKISSLSKGGEKALKGLHDVGAKIGKLTWDAFSATIKATAGSMVALTAGAGAFLATSVKAGAEFESAMSQVLATAGITKDTIENGVNTYDKLNKVAKELGATTQFSATEAAEALNYLVAAGYDAEKAASALPAVLNLAASGGLDLAYASDLAVDSMAALGIEGTTENLTAFSDQIAVAAQVSNAGVEDIGEAILTVGGTAKNLAGGTVELNAALSVLANRGIKGAEGGTALRNMILALGAPTDTASQKIEELGLKVYDAEGKMRPINDIFEDMNSELSTMSQEEQNIALNQIFNKVDLKSSQALLAGVGEEFDSFAQSIENSEGAGAQMAETMNDNLAGSIKAFKSALEGIQLSISDNLNKPLKNITQNGTKYMRELNEAMTSGGFIGLGESIGEVMLSSLEDNGEILRRAVITGQTVMNSIIDGIRDNSDQISKKLVSGITTSLYAINDNFTGFYNLGLKMVSQIADGLADNPDFITDLVNDFVSNISSTFIRYGGKLLDSGVTIIKAILKGISKASKGMASDVSKFFKNLGKLFINEFPELFDLGVDIITALIKGISDGMDASEVTAKEIIDTIATALRNNGDRLLDSAWTIISAIGRGIGSALPQLAGYAMEIILALADFIGLHAEEIGSGAMSLILALANTLVTEDNLNRIISSAMVIVTKFADGMLSEENMKKLAETARGIISAVTNVLFGGDGNSSKINDVLAAGAYVGGKLLAGFATALFDSDNGIYAILNDLVTSVGSYLADNFWKLGTMVMEGFASGVSDIDFSFEEMGEYIFDAKQDGTLWKDYFSNAGEMWNGILGGGLGFNTIDLNQQPPASNPLFTGENEGVEGQMLIQEQALVNAVSSQQYAQQTAMSASNRSASATVSNTDAPKNNTGNTQVQMYLYPNSDAFDEVWLNANNRVMARNGGFMND